MSSSRETNVAAESGGFRLGEYGDGTCGVSRLFMDQGNSMPADT